MGGMGEERGKFALESSLNRPSSSSVISRNPIPRKTLKKLTQIQLSREESDHPVEWIRARYIRIEGKSRRLRVRQNLTLHRTSASGGRKAY